MMENKSITKEKTIWKTIGNRIYYTHGDIWGFINYSDIIDLILVQSIEKRRQHGEFF